MCPGRTCTSCSSAAARACSFCSSCDVCTIRDLGYTVTGMPAETPYTPCTFKETAKFMVTNTLEVFEASPVKMVELMSGTVDSFKGIKTCSMKVTPDLIKQLVLRSLLGSAQVLTETFQSGGEVEHDIGSDLGTEGSFELTFDATEAESKPSGKKGDKKK